MTEKEKMCAQMLYDANYDRALLEERDKAKDLCHQYNQFRPSDRAGQQEVLKKLLGKTGENLSLRLPSGAITATISSWAKISMPITIW